MWIRVGNVIRNTDEFTRFYIEEMSDDFYGVLGQQTEHVAVILGTYRDLSKTVDALNHFYSALERGDKAHMMRESDKRW